MTLPDERVWAVEEARLFLRGLLDPRVTPRVPFWIRRKAQEHLRHYPHPSVDYERIWRGQEWHDVQAVVNRIRDRYRKGEP